MRLRLDLSASIAKDPERQNLNEDAFGNGTHCFTLSDGASESYDSRSWAHLLTAAFIESPTVNWQWAQERIATYVAAADVPSLSWSKFAAFDRGSFATLLGLTHAQEPGQVCLFAVGDSIAILVREGRIIESFPYQDAAQFDERPHLISTRADANVFLDSSDFLASSSKQWNVQHGDQILLVTDAVGHWLLSSEDALRSLVSVTTENEFRELVTSRRADRSMRLDDSTLVRISVESLVQGTEE